MFRVFLWYESGSVLRSIFCLGRFLGGVGVGAVGGEFCEYTVG